MASAPVNIAVEGISDEAVARRLLAICDLPVGTVHIQNGKGRLDKKLSAFNEAAQYAPWLILRDFDNDAKCAGELRETLVPKVAPKMCFRIAVCAAEAWLLADRQGLAKFLGVPANKIAGDPDQVSNPKTELVNLARKSRKKAIRDDMVPAPPSTAVVGPAYGSRIVEFATSIWKPEHGAKASRSLHRCLAALQWLALEA